MELYVRQLNIEAFKYALRQYLGQLAFAVAICLFIYFRSESLFAAITVFISFVLYGLRFVYMDYLNERDNIIRRQDGAGTVDVNRSPKAPDN